MVLAAGCGGAPEPPRAWAPLPQPATAPTVLRDSEETREFLNAFPVARYRPFGVPGVGQFFVDDAEDLIKRAVAGGAQWEPHVLALFEEYVRPGTVVLEVGAHIGTHAVPVSRLVGPWGRVYAFEPQRKLHRELHHNLALNGVTNVVPLRFAIGSGDARVVTMNPSMPGNEGGTAIGSGGDPVELRSLDSFGFERVTVIKIDVEGFEDEVLAGAADTIRRSRPALLIEIMGGYRYDTAPPDVLDRIHATQNRIEALGYSVEHVRGADYLALPRPLPEEG